MSQPDSSRSSEQAQASTVEQEIEAARQRARKRMFAVIAKLPGQSGDLGDEFIRFAVEELRPLIAAARVEGERS